MGTEPSQSAQYYYLTESETPTHHASPHHVSQQQTSHQAARHSPSQRQSIPTPVTPTIRSRIWVPWSHKHSIGASIRAVHIRIVAPRPRRHADAIRRLDVDLLAILALTDGLWLTGLHSHGHGAADNLVAFVGDAFLFGALTAVGFTLLVGRICNLVFHLAAEFLDALWWLRAAAYVTSAFCAHGGVVAVVASALVIATLCEDVGLARYLMQALYLLSLLGIEAIEVLLIVVRVLPYRSWGIDVCVNEVLMLTCRVVLSDPSVG